MLVEALVISRSRTHASIFNSLLFDGIVVDRVTEVKVLSVVLDSNYLCERHIRFIPASATSKIGIMRKVLCLFDNPVLFSMFFGSSSFQYKSTALLF